MFGSLAWVCWFKHTIPNGGRLFYALIPTLRWEAPIPLPQSVASRTWRRVRLKGTAADVRRVVPNRDHPSLDLWTPDLFIQQLRKIQ